MKLFDCFIHLLTIVFTMYMQLFCVSTIVGNRQILLSSWDLYSKEERQTTNNTVKYFAKDLQEALLALVRPSLSPQRWVPGANDIWAERWVGIPLVKMEIIALALRWDDSWKLWKESQGGVEQKIKGGWWDRQRPDEAVFWKVGIGIDL